MRKSLLQPAGGNIFQAVKAQRAEAERAGIKIINLTIGQPAGPAFEAARKAAAEAVMSGAENMHEYQDNACHPCPDFASRFVACHVFRDLEGAAVEYLPIVGIKPTLDMVIKSLGTWDRSDAKPARVFTMTNPGYGTSAYACKAIKGIEQYPLPMDQKDCFLFDPELIRLKEGIVLGEGDMIMLNFPHNPTGIIAREEWLRCLCAFCESRGIRLFNDGAYHILAHNDDSVTLADVAIDFPNLNWAEAFSASKAGNFTGWRIGAIVGSPEFVNDIKRIKGESDSGFVAFAAAGVLDQFEKHGSDIVQLRGLYKKRLRLVADTLTGNGMRLSVEPEAGFFLLFDSPSLAFGQECANAAEFNALMIQKTGIAGVPFGKWIRYAICATDVEAVINEIEAGFMVAEVVYYN
ncbi:MAG TPA: pyridoxal phosphate-dependent aminotransferase [Candidatus Paceibacterota bacterium]|jgi:aspartate/methionine/tyrosine aminotransferase|nr:pyridoxal phosphate-dependent aminotransferase [Candidatus Paceibacterota bacterium]